MSIVNVTVCLLVQRVMQTHSCHHAKPCGERKECFGDNKLQAPTQYSGNLNTTQGT